jgi:hypothetical protein
LTETAQKVRSAQPPAGIGATGIGGQQQQQNNVNNGKEMVIYRNFFVDNFEINLTDNELPKMAFLYEILLSKKYML